MIDLKMLQFRWREIAALHDGLAEVYEKIDAITGELTQVSSAELNRGYAEKAREIVAALGEGMSGVAGMN